MKGNCCEERTRKFNRIAARVLRGDQRIELRTFAHDLGSLRGFVPKKLIARVEIYRWGMVARRPVYVETGGTMVMFRPPLPEI